MIKKPMLAASMEDNKGNVLSLKDLKFPVYASIKLDGIRALRVNGKTLSRSFKPIPNRHIQKLMNLLPDGLDGELVVVGEEFAGTSSGVMSRDGEPNIKFQIFDYVKDDLNKPYTERIEDLKLLWQDNLLTDFSELVLPTLINNAEDLLAYEDKALLDGHEGIMVRSAESPYKCGRSTFKEGYLIKIKRFKDSEAIILGFEEKMRNENEAKKDELGHTSRSSSKDGLVPAGTLGTLLVRDIYDNREFGIGTYKGLKAEDLQEIWNNRDKYIGKIVKYKYQEVGSVDLPRIPSFQGFRDKRDM